MADSRIKTGQRKKVRILLMLAGLLILLSIAAPFLMPNDPNATNAAAMKAPPSREFPLGTDKLGRCVLSRVMAGASTSVFSALGLVFVSFVIGTAAGMLCGYYGGILDTLVMRIADIFLAFPQMVLAIAVAGMLGGGLFHAMLALGLTGWTMYARLARSETMRLCQEEFVFAAQFSGCKDVQILLVHILPNIAGTLLVTAATQIGTSMIGIAGLSFLGVGVTPPQAEWGSMINEARSYLQTAPWAVLAPAGAMLITVMLFNRLGDALRDLMDEGERKKENES